MKKTVAALVVLTAIVAMAGCSRQRLTREEWLQTTSRTYGGVSKDQVIHAAERLLILCDGDDFMIAHADEGFYAHRNWMVYMVLVAAAGSDHWVFKAFETDAGVKATVQVSTAAAGMGPMATTSGGFSVATMPTIGTPIDGTALYDLFWARMDFLLGKSATWMECSDQTAKIHKGLTWGNTDTLCMYATVKDERPVEAGPRPEKPVDKQFGFGK